MVQRLFVRHIVTETENMAKQVVQWSTFKFQTTNTTNTYNSTYDSRHWETLLLQSSSVMDPFATLAKMISSCPYTRDDGGIIGWIDRPSLLPSSTSHSNPTGTSPMDSTLTSVSNSIISDRVINDLYQLRPKAGDIHVLYDTEQQRYHTVQVTELWMNTPLPLSPPLINLEEDDSKSSTAAASTTLPMNPMIGSLQGNNIIVPRRKSFRGSGIRSEFPQQPQTYSIQTSGCQMNVADSERLEGILQYDLQLQPLTSTSAAATTTNSAAMADIVLFNTCSIRDHAEQKVYDVLGPYVRAKRQGRQMALIVTGCVAQQEGERLIQRIPEIDAVVGPQYIPYLSNILDTISYGQQVVVTAPMLIQDSIQDAFLQKPVRGHTIRAWVNIIHGCNEHCTYCVVPGTRGMEQSRTMEHILQECIQLQQQGYKEVTLLGQNIDAYGRDMIPKRTFADLLNYLNHNIPNPMRIRYVTSHPRYFSDRVIDAVASLEKVCECFHMPFQAGDDEVLKNMRRGYTYDSYMSIIRKIRTAAPDAAICADIIVGFPGETEEQFGKTLQLMEEVQFDNVNSFVYSPRPNTEAALYTNQIDDAVKSERLQRVQELAIRHGYQRSLRYMNRTVEVLVEDVNPRNSDQVMGRTRQGRQVYFDGDINMLLGELVPVRITEARTWSLMGEMVV
jgi:tRNA-2-methylthio-N6-dimethylallyladenosine synthase